MWRAQRGAVYIPVHVNHPMVEEVVESTAECQPSIVFADVYDAVPLSIPFSFLIAYSPTRLISSDGKFRLQSYIILGTGIN